MERHNKEAVIQRDRKSKEAKGRKKNTTRRDGMNIRRK
jgi:hypothetical protein